MKFKYMSVALLFFLHFIMCFNGHAISMVVAFLSYENNYRITNLLIPGTCLDNHHKKTLAKQLFTVNMNVAESFQENTSEHFIQRTVIFIDLDCHNSQDVILEANRKGYFKSPYRWLILDSKSSKYGQILRHVDVLVDSEVTVAVEISELAYRFIEVYKISEASEIIEKTRGAWRHNDSKCNITNISPILANTSGLGLNSLVPYTQANELIVSKYGVIEDYRKSKVVSSGRHNLMKHVLTMANVVTDSNETRKHLGDRLLLHQDSIAKMSYIVVNICFEMLNASERLVFTHTWGYRDQQGNWAGQVDLLLKKEADLGTLSIFTKERTYYIDYIAMVGSTAVRFVFREPPLAYVSNIFALPFSGAVWLAILICVLGCSVFLYIASKWEASVDMHPLQLDGSWADVLILIIGAVLQQGCTLEPRYAAGRTVTLILFLSLTILYAAYSANIVVLLRAPSSSVRTLNDLLNSPLKLGASDFEYNRYFFKKLNEPVRKSIYNKKIAPKGKKPNFYSMKEGIEKIRQGLFAFHMELNPGYRLIQDTYLEHEKCDLVEIDYINEIDPWLPGQRRSPFKDLFKINFLKIRESGIQSCIHRRLHVPRPHCSGAVSTFSSVGLPDIYPALLITLYGFLVAPVTLLIEITYRKLLIVSEKRKLLQQIEFRN